MATAQVHPLPQAGYIWSWSIRSFLACSGLHRTDSHALQLVAPDPRLVNGKPPKFKGVLRVPHSSCLQNRPHWT